MAKCIKCNNDYSFSYNLKIKGKTIAVCPNCSAFMISNGEMEALLENDDNLIDMVTGKNGAIHFSSLDEKYTLEKESMLRLLSYHLTKKEYIAIRGTKNHPLPFMIHDDFYSDNGYAYQPIN